MSGFSKTPSFKKKGEKIRAGCLTAAVRTECARLRGARRCWCICASRCARNAWRRYNGWVGDAGGRAGSDGMRMSGEPKGRLFFAAAPGVMDFGVLRGSLIARACAVPLRLVPASGGRREKEWSWAAPKTKFFVFFRVMYNLSGGGRRVCRWLRRFCRVSDASVPNMLPSLAAAYLRRKLAVLLFR